MRSHKGPNVTTAERDLVIKWTKRCLRELAKKEHELVDFHLRPQTVASLQATLMVNIKARNQRSNGGRNQITIDVRDAEIRGKRERFGEYKAYASDPVIGDITIFDQEQGIAVIVAHEVAHHVQYRYGPYTRWLKKSYRKPHGRGFQEIYRILRSRVVNPFVEDCVQEAA
jgi:hypothetical protein